jgi:hypothetical protein
MEPSAEAENGTGIVNKEVNDTKPPVPSEDKINIHESASHCVKTQLKVTST